MTNNQPVWNSRTITYALVLALIAIIIIHSAASKHKPAAMQETMTAASNTPSMMAEATSTPRAPAPTPAPVVASPVSISQMSPLGSSSKLYQNFEVGLAITIPASYSASETNTGITISAPTSTASSVFGTPKMDIVVTSALCTKDGVPVMTPTDYVKNTYNILPKISYDISRSNAVAIDRARPAGFSSALRDYREIYIFRGCSEYMASYPTDQASYFDDVIQTLSFMH